MARRAELIAGCEVFRPHALGIDHSRGLGQAGGQDVGRRGRVAQIKRIDYGRLFVRQERNQPRYYNTYFDRSVFRATLASCWST